MSRRLSRISLALIMLLAGEAWALGLGEIKLQSALNEPLRAEIVLLSATPEELSNLTISMASAETFQRYGLDRPVYLQSIAFQVRESGRSDGNVIEVRSATPITEPFVTFLVEASWARGRLLREYTLLLDPPTFTPPAAAQPTPAVTAPTRSQPADSGRIERPAPVAPAPEQKAPVRTSPPRVSSPPPRPSTDPDRPYDSSPGGEIVVQPNETLWGITSRVRDDGRLTMNQTMLAIFEANPEAFAGNINVLKAGATLRIPSADDVFRINRQDALDEVQRQHAAWQPGYEYVEDTRGEPETVADTADDYSYEEPVEEPAQDPVEDYAADSVVDEPVVDDAETQNDLTLVPPDDEYLDDTGTGYDDIIADDTSAREVEIEQRIAELEAADVPVQQSLIEIRDNELAALREELAQIRGETYEPGLEEAAGDDAIDDDAVAEDQAEEVTAEPEPAARPTRRAEPTLTEKILGFLGNLWVWVIVGALVIVGGLLFWFMRRGDDDDDAEGWRSYESDDAVAGDLSATESMQAPTRDDSIIVVEQEAAGQDLEETVEAESPGFTPDFSDDAPAAELSDTAETGRFDSLEDTFSSETAINLDQSDPIAEADFHMAYGLYDQAADLVNAALTNEPDRQDLLSKLCEIYFVWGNRDAFVDAAGRLKAAVGDAEEAEWDKIVIMGQQIAGDHEMFAGAGVTAATRAVDMSLDSDADSTGTGALDMEFGDDDGDASDVFDLGDAEQASEDSGDDLDFAFGDDDGDAATELSDDFLQEEEPEPEPEPPAPEPEDDMAPTREMPTMESTVETPTIEQQFDVLSGTSDLPSLDETAELGAAGGSEQTSEATAEINLDDLDLDLDGLAETEVASLDDIDATGELPAMDDLGDKTGRNPVLDPDPTGQQQALSADETGVNEEVADASLLDATGVTQVLPDDFAVDTGVSGDAPIGDSDATMLAPGLGDLESELGDDQETMLASLDDDDSDFDYAKTEALPTEAYTGNSSLDETGELPAVASTDVDLDLDDLTAALQVSEMGDTIEQLRDDATVEQPRPLLSDEDEDSPTMALEPGELSDDLHDARTMTEVGTKLDLARAYVDMGDPAGARSILDEVLEEGDEAQRQQAQQLLDSLPS